MNPSAFEFTSSPTPYTEATLRGTGSTSVGRWPHLKASYAEKQLARMTALHVDWNALGQEPPNDKARANAKLILKLTDSIAFRPAEVTASADGGVGICYRLDGKYAAIECLNTGQIWSMWFDEKGEPQSSRVGKSKQSRSKALTELKKMFDA
jgi:hypothetical protein